MAGAETEERASCLFAKRVLDEKRRASACFAHIAYPYPYEWRTQTRLHAPLVTP